MTRNADRLVQFMQRVWNSGDVAAIDEFVAEEYRIHSDPGDPWEGQTLSREAFRQRLVASRSPFPDLHFDIGDMVSEGDSVALSWTMRGTQTGTMSGQQPSGRAFIAHGITIYYFSDGLVTGHRQVVDRLSVARQLGLL